MKLYIIPTDAPRMDERHEYLGPYTDNIYGRELADRIAGRWVKAGTACSVIRSATAPMARPAQVAEIEPAPLGLVCHILVPADHGSCANGGISQLVQRVTLMHPDLAALTEKRNKIEWVVPLREATPDAPAVTLHKLMTNWTVAQPVDRPSDDKCIGPMGGSGAWIVSEDWRWRALLGHHQPIALHDRFETQGQYDANFN